MDGYVNPTTLSHAFGVSSSTLKRWSDRGMLVANRTPGGHRRFSISKAIQMSRLHQIPFHNPTIIGLPPVLDTSKIQSGQDPQDLLRDSLEKNAFSSSRDIIVGLFIGGMPLAELFQDIVAPVLAHIGRDWTAGPAAIANEHASSQLVLESLGILRSLLPRPEENVFAVGGAPAKDPYPIPTAMVSLVLQEMGKRAINLGPDLPISSLQEFCQREKPRIAWLSITSDDPLPELRKGIDSLATELEKSNTLLALGGRRCRNIVKKPIANVIEFSSLEQFTQFCKGLDHTISS